MIYKIRQLLTFFNADVSDKANAEKARRIYVVNLFSFVGMTITFIMATSALLKGNWPLVVVLYIASSIYLIGLIAQKYAKNTSLAARISSLLASRSAAIPCTYGRCRGNRPTLDIYSCTSFLFHSWLKARYFR